PLPPLRLSSTHLPSPSLSSLSLHDALPIWLVQAELLEIGLVQDVLVAGLEVRELVEQLADLAGLGVGLQRFLKLPAVVVLDHHEDRKSTRLNSSHQIISYDVFFLKKQKYNI